MPANVRMYPFKGVEAGDTYKKVFGSNLKF